MTKEAYKLVVFPHGKQEVTPGVYAYKYVIGGILLSETEIPMASETIIMDSSMFGELTEVIKEGKKFTVTHPLGSLDSAIFMLGCLNPDHHNVDPQ